MALRVLVYSKMPLTAPTLAPVFKGLGMEAEVCADAFAAIDKGTKRPFSCVVVDWADQPEASFLLKRARQSTLNANIIAVAIVDHEPAPVEIREHRLDFLLYRPITVGEAAAVLTKACREIQVSPAPILETEPEPELQSPLEQLESDKKPPDPEDPDLVSVTAPVPKPPHAAVVQREVREKPAARFEVADVEVADDGPNFEQFVSPPSHRRFSFRHVLALGLLAVAAFCLWRAHGTIYYLSHTSEGTFHVLKESTAALLFANKTASTSVLSVGAYADQDAYFARRGQVPGERPHLGVIATEANVPDSKGVPKAFDFPLPTAAYTPPEVPPVHVGTVHVPESLRGSLPIGPPVVATGPTQIMPVSSPVPPIPQFNEPVMLSEETARARLIHSVEPKYPHEAAAQKLQGPVVLEALIARDGSVADLKIVRGYFVLSRAAIAAVKQWRFQPYVVNGRAAEMRTTITVDFQR
jgi:TonB family protein